MKKLLLSLLSLTVLMVCAQTIIMKVEMKDGTVRYIDTDAVDEFSFLQLEEIPETPVDNYLTENLWDNARWYHKSLFTNIDHNVKVTDRYVANNPTDHTIVISGWGNGCRSITLRGVQTYAGVNLEIPCQSTGYHHPEYGEIWIADADHYNADVLGQEYVARKLSYYDSYYLMRLDVVYYAPDYQDGKTFSSAAVEYITAPYYAPVNFKYEITTDNNKFSANIQASTYDGIVDHIEACWDAVAGYDDNLQTRLSEKLNSEGGTRFSISDNPATIFTVEPDAEHCGVMIVYKAYDFEGNIIGDATAVSSNYFTIYEFSGLESEVTSGELHSILYAGDYPADLSVRYNPSEGVMGATYRITIGAPDAIVVTADNIYNRNADNNIDVYIPETEMTTDAGDGNTLCVATTDWFSENIRQIPTEPSYYSPENGVMKLHVIYYPKEIPGRYYIVGNEYFVHEGPEFDKPYVAPITTKVTEIADKGDGTKDVIVEYTQARHKADNIKAIVTELSVESAVDYIVENSGQITPVSCNNSREGSFILNTSLSGDLRVVSVLFDTDGNVIGSASDNLYIKDFSPDKWTYLGQTLFEDGWIAGVLEEGAPAAAADNSWNVDLYQSRTDPTLYAIDKPWSKQTACPYAEQNTTGALADMALIQFHIYDGYVFVTPQRSGFTPSPINKELIISNIEGEMLAEYPDASIQDIIDAMANSQYAQSTFANNIVAILCPTIWIGSDLYSAKQPCRIHFPAEVEQAVSYQQPNGARISRTKLPDVPNLDIMPIMQISESKSRIAGTLFQPSLTLHHIN